MNINEESDSLTRHYLATAGHGYSNFYAGVPYQRGHGIGE